MKKNSTSKNLAAGFLFLLGCTFFPAAANAAFDLVIQANVQNEVVQAGDEFTVNMSLYNDSSTSTAYNPKATLAGMAGGFTIKNIQSLTTPSSCGWSGSSAWCSVGSLEPGASLSTIVTLQAVMPGVYELNATGTPSGTDTSNDVAVVSITVNIPPVVSVGEPSDESFFPAGSSVTLAATALDDEDGDISSQISWWSNLTGPVGNGATLSALLSNGRHSITAEVTDSNGVAGSQLFQVVVDAIPADMPTIRTIAGNGTSGYGGDGGPAGDATFGGIGSATRTPQGYVYIIDDGNDAIRRIDLNGVVTTVYTGQMYSNIAAITSDVWGNVYWANDNADDIRKLTPDGVLSVAAGGGLVQPNEGFPADNVYFDKVSDLAVNELGEIFIAVPFRHRIYRIGIDNLVHIAAGNGENNLYPTLGGQAVDNPISYPSHIALDSVGNLYISQNITNFERVFKVDTTGVLTRYAGSGARGFGGDFAPAADALLNYPTDLAVDENDELLILDYGNRRIRKVDAGGTITTVYGNGSDQISGDGGFAAEAGLGGISDLDVANNGDLLITNAYQVRQVSQTVFEVDLAVAAQGNAVAQQGGTTDIAYTVSNNLSDPVENVFLTLTADSAVSTTGAAGESCMPVSATQIKCRLDTLGANASIEIQAQVNAETAGPRTVSATVGSYFNELAPFDNAADFSYSVNAQPQLIIISPQSGQAYLQTDQVELSATAADAEDGVLDAQIEWTSSIDGSLGQGGVVLVNLSAGVHTLTAAVTDTDGGQAQQQVNVTVDVVNTPPGVTILAPADQSSFSVDDGPIAFNVNASDSEDGDLSPQMTLQSSIDGAISSPAALSVGTHVITASVTDSGGLSASDSISVTVTPHVNVAPQVTILSPADQAGFTVNDSIAFTVSAADEEDGDLSGQVELSSSIDGVITSPAMLSEGVHTITAGVTDSEGLSAGDQITLTVTPPPANVPPQIAIVSPADQASISVDDNPVTITVSANDAEDGDLGSQVSLTSSIDGAISSPAILSEGVHTITASVTDSGGLSADASITLTITPHENVAPQVNITSPSNGQTVLQGETVTLTAQATDAEDGDLSSAVTWLSSIDGAIVSPAQLSLGTHTLTASVTDSGGLTGSAGVQVTVTDTPVYCASEANYSSYEWAATVSIGGVSHASGNNGGYLDATSTVFDLQAGGSTPLQLTPGFGSSTYQEYWAVWVDFDRNGTFDTGERVYTGSGSSTLSGNITVPAGALAGQTRMRVSMKYGGTPLPCGTFTYGEVEDYTVNILPGLPYQLSSTGDHVVTRSGSTGDNVHWVVEEDGAVAFSGAVAALSYQYPGHQDGSQYRIWLQDPVSLETVSNVVSYTFEDGSTQAPPALCASSGNNANYEWINSVTLGGYVNTSGRNGGYLNMTGSTAVQANSLSIPVTLQRGGNYTEYWAVWLDVNRDGQLTTNERIFAQSGASNISSVLNMPSGVTSGQYLMRISMKYGGTPPACGSFTYGEVEDYLIEFNL